MASVTAQQVADYILRFAHDHGDPISNLRLQKLVYYAQAWHLALYNKPLFDERLEAWAQGPVVPNLYEAYRQYSWKPIDVDPGEVDVDKHTEAHLDEVLEQYAGLTAYQLERLTHQELPWQKARGPIAEDEPCCNEISREDMAAYYASQIAA